MSVPEHTTSNETSNLLRIQRVNEANEVHYWSIKHQKIMSLSKEAFKNVKIQECELCIPIYHADRDSKACDLKFKEFNLYKSHILRSEKTYGRPLIWSTSEFKLKSFLLNSFDD